MQLDVLRKTYWQIIRVTESEKYLGVIINSDMKLNVQVAFAAKKANKTLGMIVEISLLLIKTYLNCFMVRQ